MLLYIIGNEEQYMQKRKMQKYAFKDSNGKIVGWASYPKYEIGEVIRWAPKGYNLVKATVIADMGEKHWLVRGRTGKESLVWKGCVSPYNG
jgi:hypothetical protein